MIVFKESLRKGTRLNLGAREEGRNHRRRRMEEEEEEEEEEEDLCFNIILGSLSPWES